MTASDEGVCFQIFTAYPVSNYLPGVEGHVGIGGVILGLVYFLSAAVTIFWIKQQQFNAQQGMEGAAMHVIFPIYLPFLWSSSLSDALAGLVLLFCKINFRGANPWSEAVAASIAFTLQHFVMEGTAFVLMQYGCGYRTVKNAFWWALGWSISSFIVNLMLYRDGTTGIAYSTNLFWNILQLIFYGTLWITPEKWLFRREAVIFYAKFWFIFRVCVITQDILFKYGTTHMELVASNCIYAIIVLPVFILCKPFIVYTALLKESRWWQGLSRTNQGVNSVGGPMYSRLATDSHTKNHFGMIRKIFMGNMQQSHDDGSYREVEGDDHDDETVSLQQGNNSNNNNNVNNPHHASNAMRQGPPQQQIRSPLLGVEVGFHEAQELGRAVDKLRKHGGIRLLNFAYLSIDSTAKLLGTGSFSKVYCGFYKHHAVAIKMLFTQDLNPDVIKRYCNEARLLSEMGSPQHPHVVRIYGVAVLPPSVCMVLERCRFGSLSDVIRGVQGGGISKSPLALTMADRMFLALGCALGVQAVHDYSPDLCHRDIKSFNFLIDWQLHAKIADLELGEKESDPSHSSNLNENKASVDAQDASKHVKQTLRRTENHPKGGNGRDAINVTWQAPEVLLGMGYTQSADIYSLGLVLWEIIASSRTVKKFVTPTQGSILDMESNGENGNEGSVTMTVQYDSVPFSDCRSQAEIAEKIVRGYRPAVSIFQSSHSNGSIAEDIDPLYLNLLQQCWAAEAADRPPIAEVVKVVRHAWMFSMHRLMRETEHMVDLAAIHNEARRLGLLSLSNANGKGDRDRDREKERESDSGSNTDSKQSIEVLSPLISQSSPRPTSPHPSISISGTQRDRRSGALKSNGAPSKVVLDAVRPMQKEQRWQRLEEEGYNTSGGSGGGVQHGNYLILTPSAPHSMLWATKKWMQLSGYRVNDFLAISVEAIMSVVAYDMATAASTQKEQAQYHMGPATSYPRHESGSSSQMSVATALLHVVQNAAPTHFMAELTRCDGKILNVSVHAFPVFLSLPSSVTSSRDHSFVGSNPMATAAILSAMRNSGNSEDFAQFRSSSSAGAGAGMGPGMAAPAALGASTIAVPSREMKAVVASGTGPIYDHDVLAKGPAFPQHGTSPSFTSMLGSFKLPSFLGGSGVDELTMVDDPQPHPGDIAYVVLQVSVLTTGKD